ncbi:MAG: DNRLRE domain-containing protein [Pirellulales bacterium]
MQRSFRSAAKRLNFEQLESRAMLTVLYFQDGVYPDSSYTGTQDTQMREDDPYERFGAATSLNVDGDEPASSGDDVAALLRWDLSSLGPETPVSAASITLNVTNNSGGQTYSIYQVLRPWDEAQASWETWASGSAWATAGGQASSDRGTTSLGTVSPSSTGSYTVNLNSTGLDVIRSWLLSPGLNYGLVIAGSTSTNGLDFSSRETSTASNRPKLTIDTGAPGAPPDDFAPAVDAGDDAILWLPDAATLDGTVTDDGSVTTLWTVTTAPSGGGAEFADDTAIDTSVTFSLPGRYVLRLTADDGEYNPVSDEVIVDVIEDPASITFGVVGDFGDDYAPQSAQSCDALDGGEQDVADLIDSWSPNFVLTVGDNNYTKTTPEPTCILTNDTTIGQYYQQYIGNYAGMYGPGTTVNRFFPTMGNHDFKADGILPSGEHYADFFTLSGLPGNDSGNERYYKFQWGPVEFFAVSSDYREPDSNSSTGTQAAWLASALAASTAPWKVVYFHHAPYSSNTPDTGEDGYDMQSWDFSDADVVFTGHVHNFERLIVGGVPFVVTGLGGAGFSGTGSPDPGSQARYDNAFGASRVRATAASMTIDFFNTSGTLIDSFTLGPDVLVAENSTWKYLDNGSNQGTSWKETAFNDSSWSSGAAQFGRGDGDEATTLANVTTTYFRQSFDVADKSRFSGLNLNVLRDDGVAVYLNGTEVYRNNLTAGAAYNTNAASSVSTEGESTFQMTTISTAELVDGTNVLAVEIHQAGGGSTDLTFDLQLVGVDTDAPVVADLLVGSSYADDTLHPDYDVPVGDGEQLRTIPVAAANEIKIQFSEPIVQVGPAGLGADSLTIEEVSGTGIAVAVVDYDWDGDTNTATWTFDNDGNPSTTPIVSGQYAIRLSDRIMDLAGLLLDGEWENPTGLTDGSSDTFDSGDGNEGGVFEFYITLLPGDINRDNQVNSSDAAGLVAHYGQSNVGFTSGDFTGEGNVGTADLAALQARLGTDYREWPSGESLLMSGGGSDLEDVEAYRKIVLNMLGKRSDLDPAVVDDVFELLAELDSLFGSS